MCQRPTIFFSHEDSNQLMEIVKTELKKLLSWFQGNKLSINIYKPVHMVNLVTKYAMCLNSCNI